MPSVYNFVGESESIAIASFRYHMAEAIVSTLSSKVHGPVNFDNAWYHIDLAKVHLNEAKRTQYRNG